MTLKPDPLEAEETEPREVPLADLPEDPELDTLCEKGIDPEWEDWEAEQGNALGFHDDPDTDMMDGEPV